MDEFRDAGFRDHSRKVVFVVAHHAFGRHERGNDATHIGQVVLPFLDFKTLIKFTTAFKSECPKGKGIVLKP